MGHPSPSHQWDTLRHSMFLLTLAWARGKISVPGCDSGTDCFADGPERPEHGSRSRARTTGRDFGDPGACLHRYTINGAHRSVSYTGYVSTLAPMGKSIV